MCSSDLGKQRALMDRTFRDQQQGKNESGALAKEQGQLRQELGNISNGLRNRKSGASGDFRDADRNMNDSRKELGGNDLVGSSESQKEVLNALRKSAGSLANELLQEQGREGNGSPADEGADPLGRAEGSRGGLSGGMKLPSQSELERARSILEELRRRAAERGRPKEELDYIDRLLKEF